MSANSILGIIPTPICKDSLPLIPASFAPIPHPAIFPIMLTVIIASASITIVAYAETSVAAPSQRLAPIHTKNKGIKRPYPMVFTSSIIFLDFTLCPISIPATNAPIIPEIPALSAKNEYTNKIASEILKNGCESIFAKQIYNEDLREEDEKINEVIKKTINTLEKWTNE